MDIHHITVDRRPTCTTLGRICLVPLMALLFSVGCRHAPTQPSDTSFALSVEDVSCTEVFLQLQLGSGIASRQVTLKRDTVVVFAGTVMATESTLIDSSLLPNHSYSYTANVGGNTQSCTATTMDTTSHAMSFTTTSLGDGNREQLLVGCRTDQ